MFAGLSSFLTVSSYFWVALPAGMERVAVPNDVALAEAIARSVAYVATDCLAVCAAIAVAADTQEALRVIDPSLENKCIQPPPDSTLVLV